MPILHRCQDPPFCLQIELTEGCNLRCSFCGINGVRNEQRRYKFMSVTTAKHVTHLLRDSRWLPRIEFAMHGEPSLHSSMLEILRLFRRQLPGRIHLMMTSNGIGFLRDLGLIDQALQYLNVLGLEEYAGIPTVPRILDLYCGEFKPIFYPDCKQANPHRRRKQGEHELVIIRDISRATSGTHATLNNHCGCGAPPNDNAVGRRCAKPFRELSIRWNGNVAICCNDWRGYYKVGNVLGQTLKEIWQGPALRAARRKLYYGLRDFGPCQGCDALSYRPGLLPDKKGQANLPKPTEEDLGVIEEALSGSPYTAPVWRPWELSSAGTQ